MKGFHRGVEGGPRALEEVTEDEGAVSVKEVLWWVIPKLHGVGSILSGHVEPAALVEDVGEVEDQPATRAG